MLAAEWLEDNCPCSVNDYYTNCAPLMPTHIGQFRTLINPKMSAAKEALARLSRASGRDPKVKISGDTIEFLPNRKSKESFYDYSWLPKDPEIGSTINMRELGFEQKRRDASEMAIKRRGYVSIGKAVFEYRGKPTRKGTGHE